MLSRIGRIWACRRAAAAIEFAIVAPVFVMAIMAMIGYGIYLSAASSVQQMTEDAARAAIAGLDRAERQALADTHVASASRDRPFIDPTRVAVTVTESETQSGQLTVQVDYDAADLPIWQLFSYAMPASRTISRRSVVRIGGV